MTNEKLEEIYYKYYQLVKDTAYKVLHDHEFTEDVCHDVFLKLSDEWIEADISPEKRENYLRVAALRKAIDYYNVRKQYSEFLPYDEILLEEELAVDTDLDGSLILKDFTSRILLELKRHNENWYMVILKYEVYHEPVELIAREMGVKVPLIRLWLYRAKKWIKKHYGEEYQSL